MYMIRYLQVLLLLVNIIVAIELSFDPLLYPDIDKNFSGMLENVNSSWYSAYFIEYEVTLEISSYT